MVIIQIYTMTSKLTFLSLCPVFIPRAVIITTCINCFLLSPDTYQYFRRW
ncbi:hypothetical protein E2C01_035710 [Portunus trituberculatus]|uniref:Uncharacterized protein n=1 Tax=Portunus trituberculatus TaxID=210409 RepID=A0A5B7F9X1_PORTR|nr:hypothetical protein [Portunus trituberculatus]